MPAVAHIMVGIGEIIGSPAKKRENIQITRYHFLLRIEILGQLFCYAFHRTTFNAIEHSNKFTNFCFTVILFLANTTFHQ